MGTARGHGRPTNQAPVQAGRFEGPLLSSRRVPPACAERYALGVSNAEALPRLRRLVADDEGNEGGQQESMDRFGVTAGRAGVDLTVGILTSPRRRVEIRRPGSRPRRSPVCLPRKSSWLLGDLSFRKDPSDEPIEGLEPDEVSLGVHQGTAERRQKGPGLRLQTDEPSGGSRPNPPDHPAVHGGCSLSEPLRAHS